MRQRLLAALALIVAPSVMYGIMCGPKQHPSLVLVLMHMYQ